MTLPAVVLCNDFKNSFRPLTTSRPACLLPLCNAPLLDYTLRFLVLNGVSKVYLFCTSHADQIRKFVLSFSHQYDTLHISTIICPSALSIGDVMRDLDAKQILTEDFLLLQGDLVANVDLSSAVSEHLDRRKTNKDAIMTMVLHQGVPTHDGIFVIDTKKECVYYDSKRIDMDRDKLRDAEIRADLLDPQIDVCSPDVPALYTENFDWQDRRKDFVHGVLTSDLLGKSIYTHIIRQRYAARVRNIASYDQVSRDVIARWSWPVSPYALGRNFVYKGANAKTKEIHHAVIGKDSVLRERAEYCVVGESCHIASPLSRCYILSHVKVGKTTQIGRAIVGHNVSIGEDCIIGDGVLIADGVVISDKVVVEENARIQYEETTAEGIKGSYCSDSGEEIDIDELSIGESDDGEEDDDKFAKEAQASLDRALTEDHPIEVAALELNTLRMAANATSAQVRLAVVVAIMQHELSLYAAKKTPSIAALFEKWSAMFERINTSDEEREETIELVWEFFNHRPAAPVQLFGLTLRYLYEYDVIEEADLECWLDGRPRDKLVDIANAFLTSLLEADEESSSSSSSND